MRSASAASTSSARSMAAVTRAPPQSRTLANSQRRPSETATVVRSCPIETATRAASARSPVLERLAADGAQQGEGLDVDADELDLRRGASGCEAVDEVAVGDGEQHAVG